MLKLIDKYNTIYNINNINKEWHCKTKIKGADKTQLVYRMLWLLITKINSYIDK